MMGNSSKWKWKGEGEPPPFPALSGADWDSMLQEAKEMYQEAPAANGIIELAKNSKSQGADDGSDASEAGDGREVAAPKLWLETWDDFNMGPLLLQVRRKLFGEAALLDGLTTTPPENVADFLWRASGAVWAVSTKVVSVALKLPWQGWLGSPLGTRRYASAFGGA